MRLSWLPRLIDRYQSAGRIPSNLEEIACQLGVGKNMAKSMRAWGRAAGMLLADGRISDLALRLFAEYDRYLERGQTVALLHWQISSNSLEFSSVAWLFNRLRSQTFTMDDAVVGFRDYLYRNGADYALKTVRGDIEAALRMHAGWNNSPVDEIDDRFFSQLRLLENKRIEHKKVFTRTWEHQRLHVSEDLLLYSLLLTLARRQVASAAMSTLYMANDGYAAPGMTFGFTKDGFFSMVESLDRNPRTSISLTLMPGEDAMLSVTGNVATACASGSVDIINQQYLERAVY